MMHRGLHREPPRGRRGRKEWLPWLAVFLALVAARPAAAQGGEEWRRFVGCYREGGLLFALDSLPAPGRYGEAAAPGVRQARILDSGGSWKEGRASDWRVSSPDTIVLVESDGLNGSERRLAPRGDTLEGTREILTDVVGPPGMARHREPVRAIRASCSSRCVMRAGRLVIDQPAPDAASAEEDPVPLPYLAGAEWYARHAPIVARGLRFMRYGLPRVLSPDALVRAGEHEGVALFADADAGAGRPEVFYALLRPGASCEFQTYMNT